MSHRARSEAQVEFGETVSKTLKLSPDRTKVLWPQPSDDPEDPQNVSKLQWMDTSAAILTRSQWSDFRKGLQLFIITLAAIVPDFDGATGNAYILPSHPIMGLITPFQVFLLFFSWPNSSVPLLARSTTLQISALILTFCGHDLSRLTQCGVQLEHILAR